MSLVILPHWETTPDQLAAYTARVIELCAQEAEKQMKHWPEYHLHNVACLEFAAKIRTLKPTGKED